MFYGRLLATGAFILSVITSYSIHYTKLYDDIQNSLLKFNDLQDFYSRMIIVADNKRKADYLNKIKYSSFKDLSINNRVSFLDYESLNKQYERLIEQQSFEIIL